jgi:hypothetical protein
MVRPWKSIVLQVDCAEAPENKNKVDKMQKTAIKEKIFIYFVKES